MGASTGRSGRSYRVAIGRYKDRSVAEDYPSTYDRSQRQRRERTLLRRLIHQLPAGSHVLDLPCGTGRVTRLLLEAGLTVTGADSSPHMVDRTRSNMDALGRDVEPVVCEALQTGFPEAYFDAVFCNRLFHHFREAETRIAVLSELRRISRGPVMVSFGCRFALGSAVRRMRRRLCGRDPRHCGRISCRQFHREVQQAGLSVQATIPVLWGVSWMWYVHALPPGQGESRRDEGDRP